MPWVIEDRIRAGQQHPQVRFPDGIKQVADTLEPNALLLVGLVASRIPGTDRRGERTRREVAQRAVRALDELELARASVAAILRGEQDTVLGMTTQIAGRRFEVEGRHRRNRSNVTSLRSDHRRILALPVWACRRAAGVVCPR